MNTQIRMDAGRVRKWAKTAEGWVRVWADISNVGDLTYAKGDGTTYTEQVDRATLMDPEYADSLRGIPVTLDHPIGTMLDATNTAHYQRGSVCSDPFYFEADGVQQVEVIITDASTIQAIENGVEDVSLGYRCQVVDGVQRNRRANHLAICSEGRAHKARLRLDSAAYQLTTGVLEETGEDVSNLTSSDPMNFNFKKMAKDMKAFLGGEGMSGEEVNQAKGYCDGDMSKMPVALRDSFLKKMGKSAGDYAMEEPPAAKGDNAQLRIDGSFYPVPLALVPMVQRLLNERDVAQARVDTLTEDKAKSSINTDALAALVQERVELWRQAETALGSESKFDPKLDSMGIRQLVIKKLSPKVNLDGKSDAYIAARYDALMETGARLDSTQPLRIAIQQTQEETTRRQDEVEKSIQDAQTAYEQRVANNWKTK